MDVIYGGNHHVNQIIRGTVYRKRYSARMRLPGRSLDTNDEGYTAVTNDPACTSIDSSILHTTAIPSDPIGMSAYQL
jgi:hypothetical protein